MKKLLLLFLLVAGGVSTVSADNYVLGCHNGGDWYKGADFSANGDGTYTATIEIPANNTAFMFTVFGSSSVDWDYAWYAFSGSGTGNLEAYGSGKESGTMYASGHGVLTFPRTSHARTLEIVINPTTKSYSITRMIAVASGYNSWSTSTDYLIADTEGSEVYTGKVCLEVNSSGRSQASGFKYVFLNNGNVYWGTNKGDGYIGDGYQDGDNWVAYNNATVGADGIYDLTANISTWAWTAPTLVTVPASVGTYGMATLCSEYALDFTGLDEAAVKAYAITDNDKAAGTLSKTQVTGKVPAGTGLYIEGAANASINVPTTICTDELASNMLKGVTSNTDISQTESTYTNYILTVNTVGGTVGTPKFYKVNTAGNTVLAGKAYLQIPTAKASRESFWFDNDVTAIKSAKQEQKFDGMIYNLAGQRVAQSIKGLYIVNGKKVIK